MAVGEHLGYLFTGLWTALAGVALIQSDVLHPLFGVVGLLLAPLFVLGSLEFVGPFEPPHGWKLARTIVPWPTSTGRSGSSPSGSACSSRPERQKSQLDREASTCQESRDPGDDELSETSP